MEEKEIIQSTSAYAKILKRVVVILLLVSILITLGSSIVKSTSLENAHKIMDEHSGFTSKSKYRQWDKGYEEQYKKLLHTAWQFNTFRVVGLGSLGLSIVLLIIYLYSSKMQITVTDKRVYGQAAFGKRVDLPIDSISAISQSAFKGLAVATSAGKIKFVGIKNRDQIHEEITKLLTQRQGKPVVASEPKQEIHQSSADELKKYKELLDSGIITQEEFDAKKKQLLGL